MKMIPNSPCGTHSRAELLVFDRLHEISGRSGDQALVAFHSLRLTRHQRKRFCEIDFLLCGPQGLFALEVKGGGISCRDGKWITKDRYGVETILTESPFQQAQSAMHALVARLEKEFPGIRREITIGFGVLFPDCSFDVRGVEWERQMVGDMRDLRDMEGWLDRFSNYWQDRDGRHRAVSGADVARMIQFLRPNFDVAEPLYRVVEEVENRVASLTGDQMIALDTIEANPRVLCHGGAGTGKTFLGIELARRWSAGGMRVLVACRSLWLRRYLEARFTGPGLTVAVVDGIETAARRAGVSRFDALIVDEGQDLFDMESLDRLEAALAGGLTGGRWCVFHDSNNQAGFFGPPDPDAVAFLDGLGVTKVPLTTNCRNTRVILERVKRDLGADMGVRGAGEGPAVREHFVTSKQEAATKLTAELAELIDTGGLSASGVTILSPLPFEESCAALLPRSGRMRIIVLDEFSLRSFPPGGVSFATISAFKGLENEAVILVDIEGSSGSEEHARLMYVGMSRPRAVLSMVRYADRTSKPLNDVSHPHSTTPPPCPSGRLRAVACGVTDRDRKNA